MIAIITLIRKDLRILMLAGAEETKSPNFEKENEGCKESLGQSNGIE